MPRLILDIDNVVARWDDGWRRQWNVFNRKKVPAFSTTWDSPFEDTGLDPGEFWEWTDDIGLWEILDLTEGAGHAVWAFCDAGWTVEFATFRHRKARVPTVRWMERKGFDKFDLHFVKDKADLLSSPTDMLVDDSPEQLRSAFVRCDWGSVVRFEQPWNLDSDDWHWSVKDFAELENLVLQRRTLLQ